MPALGKQIFVPHGAPYRAECLAHTSAYSVRCVPLHRKYLRVGTVTYSDPQGHPPGGADALLRGLIDPDSMQRATDSTASWALKMTSDEPFTDLRFKLWCQNWLLYTHTELSEPAEQSHVWG